MWISGGRMKAFAPGRMLSDVTIVGRVGPDVYEARDALGRRALVRVADPPDEAAAARFVAALPALVALDVPGIVPVLGGGRVGAGPRTGGGTDAERVYGVRAWSDGTPLRAMRAAGPIPLPHVVGILEQVARALCALHGAGVAHGKLNAGEILIEAEAARLADVALAPLRCVGDAIDRTADVRALGRLGMELYGRRVGASMHFEQLLLWMIAAPECAPTIRQVIVEAAATVRSLGGPGAGRPVPPPPPGAPLRSAAARAPRLPRRV